MEASMVGDIRKGKGFGFYAERHGEKVIYLVRCFKCGKENYAPAVATGKCSWCGFDANKVTK
jgi:ribosomal protein L37E